MRVSGQRPGGDVRVGGPDAARSRITAQLEPSRQGTAAAVPGQDDRTEPGAGDAADPALPAGRGGEAAPLSAASLCRRATRGADIELLAAVDEAHETLSGPATQKILQREYQRVSAMRSYQRLAAISVAQLYRLRKTPGYRKRHAQLPTDAAHAGLHRRAAQARSARPAGLSARRHGASRRPGWSQGRVSHQRGG